MAYMPAGQWCARFWFLLFLISSTLAYEVSISDKDYSRQVCSGMWAGSSTYINVTFTPESQGEVAMVIYEWEDVKYLGKERPMVNDEELPPVYICTTTAALGGYCNADELGRFILNLPAGIKVNDTSYWSARVQLPANKAPLESVSTKGFWDNPDGNPTPPPDENTSPWRRSPLESRQLHEGIFTYDGAIHYPVRKTGFYCVAVVPISDERAGVNNTSTDVPFHPSYEGHIFFKNVFNGKLSAADYPKTNFYFIMFLAYAVVGIAWGWLCYRHLQDLLPIQYYLSGLVALLIVEMFASWAYYRYLNAHGRGTTSTIFLIVVSILDAGRNSMSFFMLLVVSLGLSVVRESLGRTMLRCQALAGAHFIFGILYGIGIVELELESTSALILLLFIIPLAFTLSGFLLWIMYSLNATIQQLRQRKQRYKLGMFQRLHYILIFAVLVIAAFFVVSSMSFSSRLAEDYAARTWKSRWWLLDAWLALLYYVCFVAIAFLWRPSENNRRLAMSDELAQDENDAEDYDLQAIQSRSQHRDDDDDDAATLVGGRRGGPGEMMTDQVVFEIGDEDDEDESPSKNKKHGRLSGENPDYRPIGSGEERETLMSRND